MPDETHVVDDDVIYKVRYAKYTDHPVEGPLEEFVVRYYSHIDRAMARVNQCRQEGTLNFFGKYRLAEYEGLHNRQGLHNGQG